MKITVSQKIFEKYPSFELGVIAAENINNQGYNQEVQSLLRLAEKELRANITPEKISEIKEVKKWRETYSSFGAKPSDYRSSVESLIRRTLKKDLPKINSIVDIYNYISIKYLFPVGGEDLSRVREDIILDFAEGNEEFIPLGETKKEFPWKGEVIYKDSIGAICRCWNWREGDRTKLTEKTKKAVIVIENLIPENKEKLGLALEETKSLIEKYCNAKCKIEIINSKSKY
ncbi:hypothetical protein HYT57_00035 [Candidatus Woesearchaeota archaeon]|nr:hypothetical protein [Candidatus Woesearchaeota archaeon]